MWPFKRRKLQKDIIELYHMLDKRREVAKLNCDKDQFMAGVLFESAFVCSELLFLAHNNGFYVGSRD